MSTVCRYKGEFHRGHRGASGLRKIEDSSWSFLKYYSGSTFLSMETEEKCLRAGTPDTRAVNKLAMNAGIIIV